MHNNCTRLVPAAPESEYSRPFLQGMLDRMALSFHKYGRIALIYPKEIDALRCLRERLRKYETTGNTEWLMDVANFAMIEFMHPGHPEAHFRPTTSAESPGRNWHGERDASSRGNREK
jgi:hypothetical protein